MTSDKEQNTEAKLESLATLAYDTIHWLERHRQECLFVGPQLLDPSPISKLEMTAQLYFPELKDKVFRISSAEVKYREWVIRSQKEIQETGPISETLIDDYSQIYQELHKSVFAVAEAAGDLIRGFNRQNNPKHSEKPHFLK